MAKRPGNSTNGVSVSVKKRKGIKIQTFRVPDSEDEEDPPPNIQTEYARLLKTRVTTSGKIDSVTMKTLRLFEAKDVAHDSSGPTVDFPGEVMLENALPAETLPAKKKRKKANDSVRTLYHIY